MPAEAKKESCLECKKRQVKFECWCGATFCSRCSDNGDFCPADEQIEHTVTRIKKSKK